MLLIAQVVHYTPSDSTYKHHKIDCSALTLTRYIKLYVLPFVQGLNDRLVNKWSVRIDYYDYIMAHYELVFEYIMLIPFM